MLEPVMVAVLGFLLLAAASFRYRREAGVSRIVHLRALRLGGAALLLAAFLRCETRLDGLRWVELLTAGSIAGVIVVLLLSVAPGPVLAPIRHAVRLARGR